MDSIKFNFADNLVIVNLQFKFVEQSNIQLNSFFYFVNTDIFIGGMRTGRVSRTNFDAWKRHQCLIGEGRGTI